MSWRDFEHLVHAWFERQGYQVESTAAGADGGVDLVARKGGEVFLVQCKQWRAHKIGVSVVRELYGVMVARGAAGGFVVGVGEFTSDALEFAEGRNIELTDARAVIGEAGERTPSQSQPAGQERREPECPRCGSGMVRRTARRGANAGQDFYGCSQYPNCRGTRTFV
ncbi:restriction endonuclease [Salinisphaera sp. PC39]|uniref:restriction endonuclease n=1 Tax=Salinisphaera sp. PC39 TaxID=1304156 RepID=UPI003342C234